MIWDAPAWSLASPEFTHGFPKRLIVQEHWGFLLGNITVSAKTSNLTLRQLAWSVKQRPLAQIWAEHGSLTSATRPSVTRVGHSVRSIWLPPWQSLAWTLPLLRHYWQTPLKCFTPASSKVGDRATTPAVAARNPTDPSYPVHKVLCRR